MPDVVVVWDRQRKPDGEQRCQRSRRLRSRQAALDPHEQRDEEERPDVEHVPLLDAKRLPGGEHGHFQHEPEGQAEGGCDEDAVTLGQPARHQCQEDQRGERDHAKREAELTGVVGKPLGHLSHRVVGAARHLVGAEEPERRAAPCQLDDQDPCEPRDCQPVDERVAAEGSPPGHEQRRRQQRR